VQGGQALAEGVGIDSSDRRSVNLYGGKLKGVMALLRRALQQVDSAVVT
jgi:hypothetical protein